MWSAAADVGRLVYFKRHAITKLNYLWGSDRVQEASRIPSATHQDRSPQNGQESSASDSVTSGAAENGGPE